MRLARWNLKSCTYLEIAREDSKRCTCVVTRGTARNLESTSPGDEFIVSQKMHDIGEQETSAD